MTTHTHTHTHTHRRTHTTRTQVFGSILVFKIKIEVSPCGWGNGVPSPPQDWLMKNMFLYLARESRIRRSPVGSGTCNKTWTTKQNPNSQPWVVGANEVCRSPSWSFRVTTASPTRMFLCCVWIFRCVAPDPFWNVQTHAVQNGVTEIYPGSWGQSPNPLTQPCCTVFRIHLVLWRNHTNFAPHEQIIFHFGASKQKSTKGVNQTLTQIGNYGSGRVSAFSISYEPKQNFWREVIRLNDIENFSFQMARLAQSVEHGTLNPRVVGSSPTLGADFFLLPTKLRRRSSAWKMWLPNFSFFLSFANFFLCHTILSLDQILSSTLLLGAWRHLGPCPNCTAIDIEPERFWIP